MDSLQQKTDDQQKVKTGLCLYCVINCPDDDELRSSLANGSIKGIGDRPIHLITHRDLAIVVSDMLSERQQATRANLLRHTEVLESVMQYQQILPIRFGIAARDEDEIISRVLKSNYWNFNELLEKLKGKKELGLKILCNVQQILQILVERDTQIRKLRDSLSELTDSAAYHEKIKLGRMLEAAFTQWKSDINTEVLASLTPLSEEHQENRLLTENMIFNNAFLIASENEPEFDRRLNALGDKYENILTFKYTGIAPPYNFVNLAVKI
jgi:hypothetical protein